MKICDLRLIARFILAAVLWVPFCPLVVERLEAAEKPRLVVVISVDQLCYEYLQRLDGGLTSGGLYRRCLQEGAVYRRCHHRHAFTFTGPGHAVMLSGAYPRTSGIIGNAWFDRDQGKTVNCVGDPDSPVVGAVGVDTGVSPRTLLTSTVGDVLKMASSGTSKVFSIAVKDRAAVLLAGHAADGAFWFHRATGDWVTSQYYRKDLPGYLRNLNESDLVESFAKRSWTLLYDQDRYHLYRPDDSPVEHPGYGFAAGFPHTLPAATEPYYYDQLVTSPFGNDLVLLAARAIIENEALGKDAAPDLMAIGLSSNDYVGHHFGPYSLEVEDVTYRTDLRLGELARYLDDRLGRDGWTLALTADHGVAPIPEYAQSKRLPAARNAPGDLTQLAGQLEALLSQRFVNSTDSQQQPNYVLKVEANQVYLNRNHPRLQGERFAEAQRVVRDVLLANPAVATAITRNALLAGGASGDELRRMLHRAFNPRRSGDVLFVLNPYLIGPGKYSTTHGSPWEYDTHVPMLLLGAGVRHGLYDHPASPAALAPTIAHLLNIDPPPAAEERALQEALDQ